MEFLTTDELSDLLRLPRAQIIIRANRGEIPAYKVCGKLRFNADEIKDWLEMQRPNAVWTPKRVRDAQ